jgi:streptogramin lyase
MFYMGYYSSTGSELVGIEPASGERMEVKLPSPGGYGLAVGADGAIYVGGVSPGNMYRFDPSTMAMRDLGGKQHGSDYVWACAASPDGKRIYGATYPQSRLLEYGVESGRLRDLGRMSEKEAYARGVCVDAFGKVWVGVGIHADLVVYDPETGRRASVLPSEFKASSTCYNLAASGPYVFCSLLFDGKLLIFDARTKELVRALSPPRNDAFCMTTLGAPPGEIYFYTQPSGTLLHYSVAEDRLTRLADGLGQCELVKDRRYVYGADDQDFFVYDLKATKYLTRTKLAEAKDGMALMTLCAGKDGFIYGSTYINQHMFRLDPKTDKIVDLGKVVRMGGQVDSMCAGRDGRIYMGSYAFAVVSVYDPARPWQPGRGDPANPREIGRIEGQYRTQRCALGPDGNLYMGTIPSYNSAPTGAFSRINPATNEITTWHDLVPGGAVSWVAAAEKHVYGAGGGQFFVFDPEAARPVYMTDLAVSAMTLASTGDIVGTAANTLFVFSPREMKVRYHQPCRVGDFTHMCTAPDGNSYGINASRIARITPGNWQVTELAAPGGQFLAADAESNLYLARGAEVYRLRLHVKG